MRQQEGPHPLALGNGVALQHKIPRGIAPRHANASSDARLLGWLLISLRRYVIVAELEKPGTVT